MRLMQYRYEMVAVIDGAVIMTLELVGARMIAPYFGNTIFVWTAVIGVILGSLAFGYWYGGRLADRGASERALAGIMTIGALVLLISLALAQQSLHFASSLRGDLRLQALVASLLLFAPFNALAGIVSPYLVKLRLTQLSDAGSSVGRLYAAGTAGSILGTFITGYWLIALVGSRALGLGLVLVLLASTLLLVRRAWWWQRLSVAVMAVLVIGSPPKLAGAAGDTVQYDGDSSYSRIQVIDAEEAGRPVRRLVTDTYAIQSSVYLDKPSEPALGYIKRLMQVAEAGGELKRVLIIGGGTYTLPRLLHEKYPETRIDVVEIDSKLDKLAEEYFSYQPNDHIRVTHADGRTFLNRNSTKYDLVVVDAFSSLTPPFALTTTEAVRLISKSLTPEGAVAVNIVAAPLGEGQDFLKAEAATYRSVFPHSSLTQAQAIMAQRNLQNVILIAGKSAAKVAALTAGMPSAPVEGLLGQGLILSDDFAPVEHLLQP